MLMIRLQRVGRRNHAEFRVVVTEKTRAAKSSNYKELVGHYNPHNNEVKFDVERIEHWMSVGAQVSDTVHNLLVREGVIKGEKINVLPKKSPIVKEEEATEEVAEESKEEAADDKAKTEEAPEETKKDEKPADESADAEKATEDK